MSKRVRRFTAIALAAIVGVVSWHDCPRAEDALLHNPVAPSLELPTFSRCAPATPPVLPQRWRAVGLMTPFTPAQLDIGEFVYDGSVPAMRASIYGLESGAADLLITNADTYLLSGPHHAPTGCTSLGPQYKPPSARWLPKQARCVGEAPIMSTPVQWWSAPAGLSHTTWHWYATETRLPWRSMMSSPGRYPAIIGDYSMTFFPVFEAVRSTNLGALRDLCRVQPRRPRINARVQSARTLMTARNEAAETERLARIETLIPGLSHQACANATPQRWPPHLGMTAMMTPQNFGHGPYPTEMLYDWSGAKGHRTRNYLPNKPGMLPVLDGVLLPGAGYEIKREASGATTCLPIYPGVIKPDWMAADKCECKGVIKNHPTLSPNDVTEIRACTRERRQFFWSWYTTSGRPVVFMEPSPQGDGPAITDYHRVVPGHDIPSGTFDLPAQCATTSARRPGQQQGSYEANNPVCTNCHLGSER